MTMLLTTRTDMFAAAFSHAGISSINNYWGFAYRAATTAKSYPSDRPDICIDRSPLFAAHNVVTSLRVLGKEVEYIRIHDELHGILQYDRRQRWSESIVAWFDRHPKDDAAWWGHLWPQDE